MIENKNLLKTIVFLNNLNNKFSNDKLRILSSNRIHKSKFSYFRYISSNKDFKNLPYCDILLNYFIKSERLYPGGSYYLSNYIVGLFLKKENIFQGFKDVEKNLENVYKYFSQTTSKRSFELLKNVLEFSGPNATLICNPSDNNNITVKKNKNPVFDISIHKDFSSIYFSKNKTKTQTFLISVMDAYIERESELIPLMDKAKDNNLSLIVFCRGLSDNASNAIKSIILRNNIYVLPYIVKFENEDPFKLEDLSKVLGCSMINAESGDGIYKDSVKKSSSGLLKIKQDSIEIFNPNKELNEEINKKINNCNDSDLKEYLFKRKSRINTNIVEILIPRSNIEMLTEIKYLIICYNNLAIYGLKEYKENLYSKKCIESTKILGNKLKNTLDSIGYIVLQNKRENL